MAKDDATCEVQMYHLSKALAYGVGQTDTVQEWQILGQIEVTARKDGVSLKKNVQT